jgi:hypothetical protein
MVRHAKSVRNQTIPYFFILPAYFLLLLILGTAAFVTRMNPKWRPARGYIHGGMIGTVPGFIVANLLVTVVGIFPAVIAEHFSLPEGLKQVCGVLAGVALLLGPFVASAAGVVLGFLSGCWIVWRGHRLRSGRL